LRDKEPFASLREHIKTKVLNLLEYQDLTYHVKVLRNVNTNWKEPKSEEKPVTSFLGQNSPPSKEDGIGFADTIQEEIKVDNIDEPSDLQARKTSLQPSSCSSGTKPGGLSILV